MFDIRTPNRIYYLRCHTEAEMNKWVDCLCQVCGLKAQNEDYNLPTIGASHLSNFSNHDIRHDSPSVSHNVINSISGPYIPISECVTGHKVRSNNQHGLNNSARDSTINRSGFSQLTGSPNPNERMSIPSEMAPPPPSNGPTSIHNPSITSLATNASSTSTLVADNHLMPTHRLARSSGALSSEDGIKSPYGTDSSGSVFNEEDWPVTTPHSAQSFFGASDALSWENSGVTTHTTRSHFKDPSRFIPGGLGSEDAPPRPPKPAHLEVPQQNYMNIDAVTKAVSNSRKNSLAESIASRKLSSHEGNITSSDAEPSPLSAASSHASCYTPGISESHNESASRVHVRGSSQNFAVSGVFSYDINEIKGDNSDDISRVSPALYTNLSSMSIKSPAAPPCVDRGLKPKHPSISEGCDAPLSMTEPNAPAIRRNLKPAHESQATDFVLGPIPQNRPKGVGNLGKNVTRAAPSPTTQSYFKDGDSNPSSNSVHHRGSTLHDEKVSFNFYYAFMIKIKFIIHQFGVMMKRMYFTSILRKVPHIHVNFNARAYQACSYL